MNTIQAFRDHIHSSSVRSSVRLWLCGSALLCTALSALDYSKIYAALPRSVPSLQCLATLLFAPHLAGRPRSTACLRLLWLSLAGVDYVSFFAKNQACVTLYDRLECRDGWPSSVYEWNTWFRSKKQGGRGLFQIFIIFSYDERVSDKG